MAVGYAFELDEDEDEWDGPWRLRIPPDHFPAPPGYDRWFDGRLYRRGWTDADVAPLASCSVRCYVFRYRSPEGPDDLLHAVRLHDPATHDDWVAPEPVPSLGPLRALAPFRTPHLDINFAERVIRVDGVTVHLTPLEARVLAGLAQGYGQLVPHETLIAQAWEDPPPAPPERLANLRMLMGRVRAKLDPEAPERFIRNRMGLGYILDDPSDEDAGVIAVE